jgi:probable HAF family extracellular repeat protein
MVPMNRRTAPTAAGQVAVLAACLFAAVSATAAPPKYRLTLVSKLEWDDTVSVIAINNAGHVMGLFDSEDLGEHTFLYKDGITFDIKPTDAHYVWGAAMNESGVIVGTTESYPESRRAFKYENGVFTKLEIPELIYTDGVDVNESNQILGEASFDGRGFLYQDGAVEILPNGPFSDIQPVAINDSGTVVGNGHAQSGNEPFVYQDGEITGTGTLERGNSRTVAINNAGRVTGVLIGGEEVYSERAFVRFTDGRMVELGTFGGEASDRSHAWDINGAGHIVGWAHAGDSNEHAFLYKAGVMTDLGTVGRARSYALDITNNGQVVGMANDDFSLATSTVFIYGVDGSRTHDLNDLIDPADRSKPYVLLKSVPGRKAINEYGQVAALGVDSRKNRRRIYLVSPIDSTPPVVTASVNGAMGSNGWYTADVTVAWVITDPQAPIGAKVGCASATVQADTPGIVHKCQAKSMGGASPIRKATVRRDTVKPSAGVRRPKAGAVYSRNQVVSVDYQCSDLTSGVQSCVGTVPSGSTIDTSQPVTNAVFRVVAVDNAGHKRIVTRTYSVN